MDWFLKSIGIVSILIFSIVGGVLLLLEVISFLTEKYNQVESYMSFRLNRKKFESWLEKEKEINKNK